MNNLIFMLFGLLIISIIIYICSIYIVKIVCKSTIEDAKRCVDKFINEIVASTKTESKVAYPVLIGSNGFTIRDEIVNTLFSRLDNIYKNWYFERADYVSKNVICYTFRVYDCLLNMDRKRLMSKLRVVDEAALSMHFHENGIYTLPADGFCAVRVVGDRMHVFYAINDSGLEEIQAIRQQP